MRDHSLRVPGEWERHSACWMAFPYLAHEWGHELERAQVRIAAYAKTLAQAGEEPVKLMVRNEGVRARAAALLSGCPEVELVDLTYADAWVRDTGPIFGLTPNQQLGAAAFTFNAWGNKYDLPDDTGVARAIAKHTGASLVESNLVLEGGAIEFNGAGVCMTTESCLLNPNRNPGRSRTEVEDAIREVLSVDRFIWLRRGLRRDHTDGHIDMVARFVDQGRVVCMEPRPNDPQQDVLNELIQALKAEPLELVTIPSPSEVTDRQGELLPASYCNFYIGNAAVIVPTYDVDTDEPALACLREIFSDRQVVGLDARPLLSQGGAFHCVTQAQPAVQ